MLHKTTYPTHQPIFRAAPNYSNEKEGFEQLKGTGVINTCRNIKANLHRKVQH